MYRIIVLLDKKEETSIEVAGSFYQFKEVDEKTLETITEKLAEWEIIEETRVEGESSFYGFYGYTDENSYSLAHYLNKSARFGLVVSPSLEPIGIFVGRNEIRAIFMFNDVKDGVKMRLDSSHSHSEGPGVFNDKDEDTTIYLKRK